VEDGVLKAFLMSRKPVEGIPQSNGHGRKQVGLAPVARQSNLIVQVAPSAVQPDLKAVLIAEIKKQGLPYGLLFDDIQGGFTFESEENATPVSLVVPSLLFEDATMRKLRIASPNPPVAGYPFFDK
jgi:hypothetical protein